MLGPTPDMNSRFLGCLFGCAVGDALGVPFLSDPERLSASVADVSRIAHQDPRSVAGGVAIAKAAQLLATLDTVDEVSSCGSIADAIRPYEATFADLIDGLPSRLLVGSLRSARPESYQVDKAPTGS
jgi:ADP-ribosylglycohydrolase